ncbi:hypothetical protein KFL_002790140 [Klebsormidium nitens]|uniref:R3H-associated N-terminal domain-containing protein n=1 Tax=Klebsormidium nitens TaxID=105231 RepID=A0A1Y1IC32_KLENI|nr:hypothetical protein KFL_002790140 [Klebsormidium nitens]|eukprot:GAQ86266.1 hypothetical protein KFL_002790140 [Klebsormidium nitens]
MEEMRGPFLMTSSLAQLWAADVDPQEGRRRKGHKRKGASGSTSMAARAEAEEERRLDFLLGKRAFRRYANEKLLQDLAGPLDADQMAMLYAPPPFGEVQATVLARITEATADNEAARAWEPFRQVDMDMQDSFLRGAAPPSAAKLVTSLAVAQRRWKAVERRLREALRRGADWPLLHEMDAAVGAYADAGLEEGAGACDDLEMQLDDAFHRLMLHGVCQYYELVATTSVCGGEHVTRVRYRRPGRRSDEPCHMRLTELLGQMHANMPAPIS